MHEHHGRLLRKSFCYDKFMRTIHRDIVGGFIFSQDGKLLLGKNRSGGVYEDSFVIPGGGVNEGETKLEALRREMLEETAIDINDGVVSKLNTSSGEHEKTLQDTGERVLVKMDFYDYEIRLTRSASEIDVRAEDDWTAPQWFTLAELGNIQLSPPIQNTLSKTGILES